MPEVMEITTGQGLQFKWNGKIYFIGNRKLFREQNIPIDMQKNIYNREEKGQNNHDGWGYRKSAWYYFYSGYSKRRYKRADSNLKSQGIKKVVMLTGDNTRAAKAISEELGLDDYYAELLPEDKVRVLGELQVKYGKIAMVGDGVNDAPALASADLGIAIGGAGTDIAMETADVVLMSAEVKKIFLCDWIK